MATAKHCLACGKPILLREGIRPSTTRHKKFCNRSCAARYNNAQSPKKSRKEHDWEAVQRYYVEYGYRNYLKHFGISTNQWHDAIKGGKIIHQDHRKPFHEMLTENSTATRHNLKTRLINVQLLRNECYR